MAAPDRAALPPAVEQALRDTRENARKAEAAYAAADKRLTDFAALGGWIATGFGIVAGLFGVLITAIVVFFTFRTAETARTEARDAATQAMVELRTQVDDSIKRMTVDAQTRIRASTAQAQAEIDATLTRIRDTRAEADRLVVLMRAAHEAAARGLQQPGNQSPPPPLNPAVADQAREAQTRPDSERGFADWLAIGLAANTDGRTDEAIAALSRAVDLAPDPPSRATAMLSLGRPLWGRQRHAELLPLLDRVLAMHSAISAPDVARALFNKGVTLGALGRGAEALAAYDDLLARFANDPAPALREQVAKALVNKGVTLGALGRGADELAAYDDLLARFADDPAPALREQVAMALVNKGVRLGALGRGADELAAYDDLLARFADDPAPAIREIVEDARKHRNPP